MTFIDYGVFLICIAGSLAIGGYYYFANKTSDDMFAARGQSTWWISGLSSFMTIFSAATFVVWGGIAYEYGLVALSINMTYGLAALAAGYFFASKWKEYGVASPADYLRTRFGPSAVHLYLWIFGAARILGVGVQLYGLCVLLSTIMPMPAGHILQDPATGNISVFWAIVLFGSVIVCYTMTGGLWAVLMTDVVQFIILTATVVFLLPLMAFEVGSWETFRANVPQNYFDLISSDFTLMFLAGWLLINLFSIGAEWAFAQRYIAVKSAGEARKSAYLIGALYLVSPIIWLTPALLYRAVDPSADPERAYMLASQMVLPVGMLGMMAAAMFSATASSFSSQLNVFSGALTNQVYTAVFRTNANDRELIWVGRAATLCLGGVVIFLATNIPHLGGAASVVIAKSSLVSGPILAPILWSLVSRKVTLNGVWIVFFLSLIVGVFFKGFLETGAMTAWWPIFAPFENWTMAQPRLTNLVIGVATPLIILTLIEVFAEPADRTLITAEDDPSDETAQPTRYDPAPARIVMTALGACSSIIFFVGWITPRHQIALILFGCLLLTVAMAIGFFDRRQSNRAAPV